jgi:hypothetical protein
MAMENSEQVQAANALIRWFNSQGIGGADAECIMLKVAAKLIAARVSNTHPERISFEMDEYTRILSHELIERIYQTRNDRGGPSGKR